MVLFCVLVPDVEGGDVDAEEVDGLILDVVEYSLDNRIDASKGDSVTC